jgi:hypothetical protein
VAPNLIERLAGKLAAAGRLLRPGHMTGDAHAFEHGADADAEVSPVGRPFEIDVPVLAGEPFGETPDALDLAAETHNNWDRLTSDTHAMRACNAHIVPSRDCLPESALGASCAGRQTVR